MSVLPRAEQWLTRQVAGPGEDLLDAGDCRICGLSAGEGHEATDPCGIVADLAEEVRALQAAVPHMVLCGAHQFQPDAAGICRGCGGQGPESHWGHQVAGTSKDQG